MRFCVRAYTNFHKPLASKNKRSLFLSVGEICAAKAPAGLFKDFDYFFPLKSNGPRRLLRRIIIIIKDY